MKTKVLVIAVFLFAMFAVALYPVDGPCERNEVRCEKLILNDEKCHNLAKQPLFAKLINLKIAYDTNKSCE